MKTIKYFQGKARRAILRNFESNARAAMLRGKVYDLSRATMSCGGYAVEQLKAFSEKLAARSTFGKSGGALSASDGSIASVSALRAYLAEG